MEEEQFLEACQSGAEEVVAAALLDETRAAALRAARTASGNSALALACARGHAGIVARLVAARHDDDVVMTRNAAGDSPLLFACLNAPATLRALGPMSWRDAARPNAAGLDAVSCAIVSQHPDNAETLLVVLSRCGFGGNAEHVLAALLASNSHALQLLLFSGASSADERVTRAAAARPALQALLQHWTEKQLRVAELRQQNLDGPTTILPTFELSDLVQGPLLRLMRKVADADPLVRDWIAQCLARHWPRPKSKRSKPKKKQTDSGQRKLEELREALLHVVPQAEAADLHEKHVLGVDLQNLSEGQLELLQNFHRDQLAKIKELLRQAEINRLVQIAMATK